MTIKVCGLKDAENIRTVAGLNPDYMGFICYSLSPRYINQLLPEVLGNLPASIYKTAVFVNESVEFINSLINAYGFNALQLHGQESPEFCQSFLNRIVVIKAFGVDDDFNFETLTVYKDVVDYFLFDTKTAGYGGSGKKFDWGLLNNYTLSVPFFLSGGISLDNLEDVKNIKHPQFYGIDLNSKFEIKPGFKDTGKLKTAFEIIKQSSYHELRS